jgi:hypothetical protein
MGFLDRWGITRRGAPAGASWSEEDIPAFLEAFQPISPSRAELPRDVLDDFTVACAAHADLKAVYLFESDFGGQGERLVTVGLVLDAASNVERFGEIADDLGRHLDSFFGDDYIFQHLDTHSVDRVEDGISPVFERP